MKLRRFFTRYDRRPAACRSAVHRRCLHCVWLFYALVCMLLLWDSPGWPSLIDRQGFDPLWPVQWLPADWRFGRIAVVVSALLASVVACCRPSPRLNRIFCFACLLLYVALQNSFGKIDHFWHVALYIAAFWCVIPPRGLTNQASRAEREATILAVNGAQGLLLMTYTLSGIYKCMVSGMEVTAGQMSSFHPDALAYQIANRLQQTNSTSLLGDFLIQHPLLAWPGMLLALYLQCFACLVTLRPHLHRLWGLGLVGFHIMSGLTLSVFFLANCLILLLLLVKSPFIPRASSAQRFCLDLPVIGDLWRYFQSRRCLRF